MAENWRGFVFDDSLTQFSKMSMSNVNALSTLESQSHKQKYIKPLMESFEPSVWGINIGCANYGCCGASNLICDNVGCR